MREEGMILGLTGATGLLGRAVADAAHARKHRVIAFSRRPHVTIEAADEVRRWDTTHPPNVRGVEAVIHLAGESIQGRWTPAKRAAIRQSRIEGTRALVTALAEQAPAATLVCASGISYYGHRGDDVLEETASPGSGFLSEVAQALEAEAGRASAHGARVVTARLGLVLSRRGGAFPLLKRLHQLGLGGRLGNGRQWISWIHEADAAALLLTAAEDARYTGPLNAVAPHPVPQAEFSRELAACLQRPAWCRTPAWTLRLVLGEQASLLLDSQRARPAVAEQAGFIFRHPTLASAFSEVLQQA